MNDMPLRLTWRIIEWFTNVTGGACQPTPYYSAWMERAGVSCRTLGNHLYQYTDGTLSYWNPGASIYWYTHIDEWIPHLMVLGLGLACLAVGAGTCLYLAIRR